MFLLKAVQKYYAEKGMDYAIEDIFVTNGGSEALIFAVMALCDPSDEIMVSNHSTLTTPPSARSSALKSTLFLPA